MRHAGIFAGRLKLAAVLERRMLAAGGVAIATAAWTALAGVHVALAPLLAVPTLFAARQADRRLAALVAGTTAVSGALLSRAGSAELTVWHGFVLAATLSGIYVLAEKWMEKAKPATTPFDQLLSDALQPSDRDLAILVDCDGFDQLDGRYGEEARDHVSNLLRRAIESETRSRDVVTRTGEREYLVVLQDTDPMEANEVLDRVRYSFERAVSDAGYDCSISVAYAPLEVAAERLPDLIGYASATTVTGDCYGAYLN
jgi:diguanylate cyclase (GGDEF)-like protein